MVRDIYRRRIDGASAKKIADDLNERGVLSPLAYKISRGLPHPTGGFTDSPDAKWSAKTVIRILQEETYTGVLLQGKQETYNHKIKNLVQKPVQEWIRTENAHEPIISKRDFDLVQKISGLDTRTAPEGDKVYLFSGLLICDSCGGRMTRKVNTVNGKKYIYYYCPTGKKNGCDHPVMLKEDFLVSCVLNGLQGHIRSVVCLDELLDSISEEQANQEVIAGYKAQIADNHARIEQARRFKNMLYENLVTGLITKEEYRYSKDTYTTQIEEAQKAIELLREEMNQELNSVSDRLRWTQHFKQFSTMTTLDRRAVITLIQSIRVCGKHTLDITYRYQMEYEKALDKLAKRKELPPSLLAMLPELTEAKEAV